MKVKDDLETPGVKPLGAWEAEDNLGLWFDLESSVNKNNSIHFHLHILTSGDWFVESGK